MLWFITAALFSLSHHLRILLHFKVYRLASLLFLSLSLIKSVFICSIFESFILNCKFFLPIGNSGCPFLFTRKVTIYLLHFHFVCSSFKCWQSFVVMNYVDLYRNGNNKNNNNGKRKIILFFFSLDQDEMQIVSHTIDKLTNILPVIDGSDSSQVFPSFSLFGKRHLLHRSRTEINDSSMGF